jgi:hypothetical protein
MSFGIRKKAHESAILVEFSLVVSLSIEGNIQKRAYIFWCSRKEIVFLKFQPSYMGYYSGNSFLKENESLEALRCVSIPIGENDI